MHTVDRNYAVATWDRVLIHIWRGEVSMAAVKEMQALGRALLLAHRGHLCSSLSVVESSSPAPSERIRPLLSAAFLELAPGMKHQALVAEGSGFRAALVRGVGVAVSAFAPSLLPFRFFSSVEEAATAIAPVLSAQAEGAARLVETVALLRGRLDQLAVR